MPASLLVLLGAAVGGYGTVIGAGGGFLLVPALLALYPSETPASLTSLSLVIVVLNAMSGSCAYAWRGRIDYRLGLLISAVSVPAAMFGAVLTRHAERGVFDAAFGVILLVLAAFIVWKPQAREPVDGAERRGAALRTALALPLSSVIGAVSGLMGIGGSPFQVIVLTHLLRVPATAAMPTVQLTVLLSALGATLVHVVPGRFDSDMTRLVPLAAGVLAGAQMGAALAPRVSGSGLMRMLAVALITVGARLIFGTIR